VEIPSRNVHHARLDISGAADRNLAGKARQLACASVAIALLVAGGCSRNEQPAIAITHVSVIDVVSGATRSDNTVIVRGSRIAYAGPSASAEIPRGARLIDGRGKFLIPGLWDMHVHGFLYVFSDFVGPLMIANGVTGVRDMGAYVDTTLRWKADIAAGREVGPRIVAGVRVDGQTGQIKFVSHVTDATDAARAIDTLSRRKDGSSRADFISTDSYIPRAAFFALAGEARRVHVPLAGRPPYSVSLVEASDSGLRSIEQEDDLMRACTSREGVFRAQLLDTANRRVGNDALQMRSQARAILSSYDPGRCASVMQMLARNHTWVTPTLVEYQPYASAYDTAVTHPGLEKFVPGLVRGGWEGKPANEPRPDRAAVESSFSFDRTLALHRAGVQLLAGTDTPRAFIYPGFSLHDELALLVKSGLSQIDALRTATYNPAAYLGALDSLGTVTQGKLADLLLLDADPLVDIRNTKRISAVIANGRLFDSTSRAGLLDHVASALKR